MSRKSKSSETDLMLHMFADPTKLKPIEKTIQVALKFENRELLIKTYDTFIRRVKSENVVWQLNQIVLPWTRSTPLKIFKIKLAWIYRHLKSRKNH